LAFQNLLFNPQSPIYDLRSLLPLLFLFSSPMTNDQ
jgi:hypothetical protein